MPGTFSTPSQVSDPDMTCIMTRAWCTCRDACRDRWLAVSVEVGGRENIPGIPGACAARNFTFLVRGPWPNIHALSDMPTSNHVYVRSVVSARNQLLFINVVTTCQSSVELLSSCQPQSRYIHLHLVKELLKLFGSYFLTASILHYLIYHPFLCNKCKYPNMKVWKSLELFRKYTIRKFITTFHTYFK